MTTPLTAYELLTGAAYLVGLPGAWVQEMQHKLVITGRDYVAVAWCPVGAISDQCDSSNDAQIAAVNALTQTVGYAPMRWNDVPGRTQAEVVAALLAAAERVRQ